MSMNRDKLSELARRFALDPNDETLIEQMSFELARIQSKRKAYYKIRISKELQAKIRQDRNSSHWASRFDYNYPAKGKLYISQSDYYARDVLFGKKKTMSLPATSKTGFRFSITSLAKHVVQFKEFYERYGDQLEFIEKVDYERDVSFSSLRKGFDEAIEAQRQKELEAQRKKLLAEMEAKQKELAAIQAKVGKLST